MINFSKSQPAPASLAIEKEKQLNGAKKSGSYKEQDVQRQLTKDFNGKCYLCEAKAGHNLQVEHFQAHKDVDIDKKFDWNNLLHCCGFCNSVKNQHKDDILNCTDSNILIAEIIEFQYIACNDLLSIHSILAKPSITIQNTVNLLNQIHQGSKNTEDKAKALRDLILEDLNGLRKKIFRFYDTGKPIDKDDVIDELQPASPFLAFKIWFIKSKSSWENDFRPYFPSSVHG